MTGRIGMFGMVGLAALAGAVGLSGCIVSSNRNNCGPTDITFSWTLADTSGLRHTCAEFGARTVVINVGTATEEFDCNPGAAYTDPLDPGTYQISFQLLDAGRNVIASVPAQTYTVTTCGVDIGNVPFTVCGVQDVSLSWHIVKNANNVRLSCDQAAATTVRLHMGGMTADFACASGSGITDPLAEGTYITSVELLGPSGQLATTNQMSVSVPHCAGVALPEIEFPVN